MSLKPSSPSNSLAFFRSLPQALHDDPSNIKGNLTLEQKQLCLNVLSYFVIEGNAFGSAIGGRVKLVETNVSKLEGRGMQGQTVCEVQVDEDMCNIYGTLHGGCAAYLIDACSSSALVTLGIVTDIDASGMSQAMNLIWHNPAFAGTKLRIVSSTISIRGRIMTAQSEIWDKERGKLLVSAVHSKVNPQARLASKM